MIELVIPFVDSPPFCHPSVWSILFRESREEKRKQKKREEKRRILFRKFTAPFFKVLDTAKTVLFGVLYCSKSVFLWCFRCCYVALKERSKKIWQAA